MIIQDNNNSKGTCGMKSYYVLFKKDGIPVCSCWTEGTDEEDAKMKAEFALICRYSNVEYDEVAIVAAQQ